MFVVIRLCTSEEKVAIYWNSLDNYLETHIDVIDDLVRYCNRYFPLLSLCIS